MSNRVGAPPRPPVRIEIEVNALMHEKMGAAAKAKSLPLKLFARLLLEAAWAARCKPVGDPDLEAAVEARFSESRMPTPKRRKEASVALPVPIPEPLRVEGHHAEELPASVVGAPGVQVSQPSMDAAPESDPGEPALGEKPPEQAPELPAAPDQGDAAAIQLRASAGAVEHRLPPLEAPAAEALPAAAPEAPAAAPAPELLERALTAPEIRRAKAFASAGIGLIQIAAKMGFKTSAISPHINQKGR